MCLNRHKICSINKHFQRRHISYMLWKKDIKYVILINIFSDDIFSIKYVVLININNIRIDKCFSCI